MARSIEVFNTETHEITKLADHPFPTRTNTAVFADNKIYIFGNYDDKGDTYRYSFEDSSWQRLDIGYKSRRHTAAVKSDKGIVVSGGTLRTRKGATDSLQIFMP